MRIDDASGAFAAEVAGSTVGDRLEVNVWRGGLLLAQDLDVTSWSLRWDAGRQVQGQASITVADDSGELAPWSLGDTLGPGGSRLQLAWVSGLTGSVVPLGWWRIRRAEPLERWRFRRMQVSRAAQLRRTNRAPKPIATADGLPWSFQNGTTEVTTATANSTVAAGPQGRTNFLRRTVTTAKTAGNSGHFYRDVVAAGPAGDVWSAGIWLRCSVAVTVTPSISARSGATSIGSKAGTATAVAANVWTFLKVEGFTVPATYDGVQLFAQMASVVPVGGTYDATNVILEKAVTLGGGYFDGDFVSDRMTLYAWTGAANGSSSTATTPALQEVVKRISGGGSVTVDADEETASIVLDRLDAVVVTKPTCLAEVAKLLEDVMPVSPAPGLPDGPVPAAMVYGDSRMDAVEDLLAAIYAVYRLGPDGALQVLPAAGVGPVWTVQGGDDGVLVSLVRALSDDGVYNAAITSGETAAGQPLVGRAYLDAGALAWGGPYGRVPIFHQAIGQTAAAVQADAATVLRTRSSAGEVDLDVICLTHPGIQLHDLVTLVASTTAGAAPMVGRVVGMSMTSSGGGGGVTPAKSMALTVRVSAETLEAIGAGIDHEH